MHESRSASLRMAHVSLPSTTLVSTLGEAVALLADVPRRWDPTLLPKGAANRRRLQMQEGEREEQPQQQPEASSSSNVFIESPLQDCALCDVGPGALAWGGVGPCPLMACRVDRIPTPTHHHHNAFTTNQAQRRGRWAGRAAATVASRTRATTRRRTTTRRR